MKKTGFIGYGHMGKALLDSLLSSGALDPKNIVVSTRTASKLAPLKAKHPEIEIVNSASEVTYRCQRIFICTGTLDVAGVIREIRSGIDEKTHLITIAGGLEIKSIESVFAGKITRLLPTLVCEVNEGFTLVCHNQKVDDTDKEFISAVFEKIGKVKLVSEDQFEIGGFLTSCAPAFLASILDSFGRSAVRSSGFSEEEAFEMLLYTILGTTNLLIETNESFAELVKRVATKGGATEQGVKVLDDRLPCVFDELIEKAMVPHETRKERTRKQFDELKEARLHSESRD